MKRPRLEGRRLPDHSVWSGTQRSMYRYGHVVNDVPRSHNTLNPFLQRWTFSDFVMLVVFFIVQYKYLEQRFLLQYYPVLEVDRACKNSDLDSNFRVSFVVVAIFCLHCCFCRHIVWSCSCFTYFTISHDSSLIQLIIVTRCVPAENEQLNKVADSFMKVTHEKQDKKDRIKAEKVCILLPILVYVFLSLCYPRGCACARSDQSLVCVHFRLSSDSARSSRRLVSRAKLSLNSWRRKVAGKVLIEYLKDRLVSYVGDEAFRFLPAKMSVFAVLTAVISMNVYVYYVWVCRDEEQWKEDPRTKDAHLRKFFYRQRATSMSVYPEYPYRYAFSSFFFKSKIAQFD